MPNTTATPSRGQRFADAQGHQWSVQEVLPLRGGHSPYFALRMRYSGTGASLVLSCVEFRAMERRGLRPA